MKCNGIEHLSAYLDSILERGGEGIMAREPKSLYGAGNLTPSLLKIKKSEDTEMKVLGILENGLFCEQ